MADMTLAALALFCITGRRPRHDAFAAISPQQLRRGGKHQTATKAAL